MVAALASAAPRSAAAQSPPGEESVLDDDAALATAMQELNEDSGRLQLYGFADFTYSLFLMDRDSAWFDSYFSEFPTFAVGNINLYLSKQIAPRWNSLVEFRLLYLPNGSERLDLTDGSIDVTDTTVTDPQDRTELLRWGGISIDRALVEWELHPLLNIRAGQWLTPYGVWNIDHGSPVLLSIRRPFVIGMQLFPRTQTGLAFYGARVVEDKVLAYHLTISNGRGPIDTYQDVDDNKGVGGRVTLDAPWLDEFRLGVSGYTGTFSRRSRSYRAGEDQIDAEDKLLEQYRELSLAADLRVQWGRLVGVAEIISQQKVYNDRARPMYTLLQSGGQPDMLQWGSYVQLGFHVLSNLTPYLQGEYMRFGHDVVPHVVAATAGVNYRPASSVTLKLQIEWAKLPESRHALLPEEPGVLIESQVAWTF